MHYIGRADTNTHQDRHHHHLLYNSGIINSHVIHNKSEVTNTPGNMSPLGLGASEQSLINQGTALLFRSSPMLEMFNLKTNFMIIKKFSLELV